MLTADVTAVVVNYHGAHHTVEAARSIVADGGARTRTVVVDNSECSGQRDILERELPPRATLIVAPTNLGFGAACNLALNRFPARHAWLVNPDARVLPGCLQALVQALDDDPALAAVAPLQYLDPGLQWLFSPAWLPTAIDAWVRTRVARVAAARARADRAIRAETVRLWQRQPGAGPLRQRALSGSHLLVRTDCLPRSVPLFDPGYFMYYEDSDLCLRLRRARQGMAVVPSARALHLWQLTAAKEDLMARSHPRYFQKHYPDSRWLQRAAAEVSKPPLDVDAAPWTGGDWPVPLAWQDGWSIELSPSDLFLPSIGRLGAGPRVEWPAEVLRAMKGVTVWARLGPLNDPGRAQRKRIDPASVS